MKKPLAIALALLLLSTTAYAADEAKKESSSSDRSKYFVSLRLRWWMPILNGQYQINKNDVEGSINDFVDDMDLDAGSLDPSRNKGGPDLSLNVKLGSYNIGVNYVTFFTGGRTVLEEKLEIDVNSFDEGDLIKSDLTFAFGGADFRYGLIGSDLISLSASVGFKYFDFTTSIIGHDTTTDTDVTISDAGNGWFPILGAVAEIGISVLEVRGELYGIAGDFSMIGDIRLALVDLAVSGHVRPWKYVSLGLGFRIMHLDASAVNIWHGDPDPVRFTLFGFFFELEGRI